MDDLGPVDDVLAADPEDGSEADEADDELEDEESVGSADATPGVFAAAAATPSVTANTPTRTMYCAFTGIAHLLAMRFPCTIARHNSFVWDIAVLVEIKNVRVMPKRALPN